MRTKQGFLKIAANLTRTGVLTYRRQDGEVVRELRHPDDVFHEDSLRSLEDAPVTDLHPSTLVSPDNVVELTRGVVKKARQDGRYVAGEVLVQNPALVKAIDAGDRRELSPGYTCRLDETSGVYEGQEYDARQVDIRYNHLAVGPKGWGRSGPEVSLHMDSKDMPSEAACEIRTEEKQEKTMETATVRIDSIDYEVAKAAAPHIEKALADRQARIDQLEADAKSVSDSTAALEAKTDELQKRLDEATSEDKVKAAVAARIDLERKARKVLGDEVKLDDKSDSEVIVDVLVKHDSKFSSEDKSEAYLQARFDLVVEASEVRNDSLAEAREAAQGKPKKQVEERRDAKAAYREMMDRNQGRWKSNK